MIRLYAKWGILLPILLSVILSACQERMICPAYQSTFILNDSVREDRFSLFADSLPKPFEGVNKTRYGIIVQKSRSQKNRELQTIAMKDVLPPRIEPDSSLQRERSVEELNRMRDELDGQPIGNDRSK